MPDPQIAPEESTSPKTAPFWKVILLSALAGGMGWGIRGQYGHETGAMVPGLLIGLVVAVFLGRGLTSLQAASAAGLAALGISFGGVETMAQTVGLTHNPGVIGNWSALTWGMIGLFIKGGLWVGFAGALMGMGFSSKRYRFQEIAILFLVMMGLTFLGIYLLNEPFQPKSHILPFLYFSASWHWYPHVANPEPRREIWGGLLFAFLGLLVFLSKIAQDRLARNAALIGALSGGIGWCLAQSVQAYHNWNVIKFQHGWFAPFEVHMNWWNNMETTFGFFIGGGLGLAMWLNRKYIAPKEENGEEELPPNQEIILLVLYSAALVSWNFVDFDLFGRFADYVFTMAIIPGIALLCGRSFPYWFVYPLVALTIAGETLTQCCYTTHFIPAMTGWILLFIAPMLLTIFAARNSILKSSQGETGQPFALRALLLTTWLYFTLNFVFFEFPVWPWMPTTHRTFNNFIFFMCSVVITAVVVMARNNGEINSNKTLQT